MLLSGKAVDATEKIYQLVKQWSFEVDSHSATLALCQIALVAGCITQDEATKGKLNEHQYTNAIAWLQKNHPNVYLWAVGQNCIGHPAAIWGITKPNREFLPAFCSALSQSTAPKTPNLCPQSPISKIHGS